MRATNQIPFLLVVLTAGCIFGETSDDDNAAPNAMSNNATVSNNATSNNATSNNATVSNNATSNNATTNTRPATCEPTAAWTFDNVEATGFRNNSSGDGAPFAGLFGDASAGLGRLGQTANFDREGYLEIEHGALFELEEGTIALWVHPKRAGEGGLFAKDGEGFGNGGHLEIGRDEIGRITVRAQNLADEQTITGARAPQESWTHVALTFGPRLMLYQDGELEGSAGSPWGLTNMFNTNTQPVVVGASNATLGGPEASPSKHFNGMIDELVVFDRALSQDEVREVMTGCYVAP